MNHVTENRSCRSALRFYSSEETLQQQRSSKVNSPLLSPPLSSPPLPCCCSALCSRAPCRLPLPHTLASSRSSHLLHLNSPLCSPIKRFLSRPLATWAHSLTWRFWCTSPRTWWGPCLGAEKSFQDACIPGNNRVWSYIYELRRLDIETHARLRFNFTSSKFRVRVFCFDSLKKGAARLHCQALTSYSEPQINVRKDARSVVALPNWRRIDLRIIITPKTCPSPLGYQATISFYSNNDSCANAEIL